MLLTIKEYMPILRKYEEFKTGTPTNQKMSYKPLLVLLYIMQNSSHTSLPLAPHIRICFPKTNLNGDPCMKKHSNKSNTSPKILPHFAPLTINHPIQSTSSLMLLKLEQEHGLDKDPHLRKHTLPHSIAENLQQVSRTTLSMN